MVLHNYLTLSTSTSDILFWYRLTQSSEAQSGILSKRGLGRRQKSKNDFSKDTLEACLEDVFRQFSKYGALYRDQRLDNFLLCDHHGQQCKVMAVDLEQVDFPDRPQPWETRINSNDAMSVMRDFEYAQYPNREPSPVQIWAVSRSFEERYWLN